MGLFTHTLNEQMKAKQSQKSLQKTDNFYTKKK